MPVSDIAKIAAMFNDNPVSQVSAYRKDAQDFYTAPDRVALDNALNYGNTQKAYEAEQRRLGQQQFDAYNAANAYNADGGINSAYDMYKQNHNIGNMYATNAAIAAAQNNGATIAGRRAAIGDVVGGADIANSLGIFGSPIDVSKYNQDYVTGVLTQPASNVSTWGHNDINTVKNQEYKQQLIEDQQAHQEKIAEIKMVSDAAASDQQIIADGIKLATGSDGIINKDTLTTYLTLMRGGQQVAQQGTAQNAYGGDLVDLANPTAVKSTGNPMLDSARGMNANNSGAQTNPIGAQVQQQYNPFSGLTMAQLQQKALELTGDPTAQSVITGIGTNVRQYVPNFLLSADTIGADAGRIQAIDNIRQALAAEQNRLRTADENNRAARIEQARQSSYNKSIGAK